MRINADMAQRRPIARFGAVRALAIVCVFSAVVGGNGIPMVNAQTAPSDTKPYDDRLVRLAEILGSVHFLRELCGSNDGQFWRVRMQALIDAEGSSALRRMRLARSFNTGYNNYSRTYNSCTASAQQAVARFLTEGAEIADQLAKTVP